MEILEATSNDNLNNLEGTFNFDSFNVSGEVEHVTMRFDEDFVADVIESNRRC